MGWGKYGGWGKYVSVGDKIAKGKRAAAAHAKKQKREPQPIELKTSKITTTFWGTAWCDNLKSYSDYANRLDRGATYVRNGSVADLVILPKRVEAIVAGSSAYTVTIEIAALSTSEWDAIKRDCSEAIDSLLDLLAGKLSDGVLKRLTKQREGLFPQPSQIKMRCSCPDSAYVCKHIAAVMYGIGSRLDSQPELLFKLRDVDHNELISQAVDEGNLDRELSSASASFAGEDLGVLFGIELDVASEPATVAKKAVSKKATAKKATAKKAAVKNSAVKNSAVKNSAVKNSAVKKTATKKAAVASAKKTTTVKAVAAEKAVVETPAAKKAVGKKAVVKKSAEKTATVKKVAVKKAAAKQAVVTAAAVKKAAVKKAVVKKSSK